MHFACGLLEYALYHQYIGVGDKLAILGYKFGFVLTKCGTELVDVNLHEKLLKAF